MIRQYMIALTMGAAGLAACTENSESSDILGVTADQTMRVGIAGPLVIRENGTYQWHARLFGVVAGAQYTWELVRAGAPDSERRVIVDSPVLEAFIDINEWDTFELFLTARSGDRVAVDRALVTLCPKIDEPVDECTARLVLADR
jgi:hypothetical protein